MSHPLLDIEFTDQAPQTYLSEIGKLFSVFDEHAQDSGNIPYGVQVDQQRFFVKSAGDSDDPRPFLSHEERIALLRNAVRLRRSCSHIAIPKLHNVIESPHGPLLVYSWVDGELLHADRATRNMPQSALQRFRRLPASEILKALSVIFELHHELAQTGWIAGDFYDGCLIYDFARQDIHVIDLDGYRGGIPVSTGWDACLARRVLWPPKSLNEVRQSMSERPSSQWGAPQPTCFQMAH